MNKTDKILKFSKIARIIGIIALALLIIISILSNELSVPDYIKEYEKDSIEYKMYKAGVSLEGMTNMAYMEKDDKFFVVIHRDSETLANGTGVVLMQEKNENFRLPRSYTAFPLGIKYTDALHIFKEGDEYIFVIMLKNNPNDAGEIPFEVKDLELYDQNGNQLDKVMVEGENDGAFFYVINEIRDDFKITAKYGEDEKVVVDKALISFYTGIE